MSRLSTESLARSSARRPWVFIGIWILVFIVFVGLAATLLPDALTTEFKLTNDADSVLGDRLIEERLTGPHKTNEILIIRSESLTVDDEVFQQHVEGIFATLVGLGNEVVEGGVHYYMTADDSLVSPDRRTTLIPFTMAIDVANAGENIPDVRDAVHAANDQVEFEVVLTGEASAAEELQVAGQDAAEKGESIAIPIALLILVVVFGAMIAALIPLIVAVISISIAMGIVALVGLSYEFSLYVTNIITMIGLAVGIDYSLFIVHRFRAERIRGLEKTEAIARAGATASRTVLFSGMTVILALAGLLLIPMNVFTGLASGAIFVVFVSVLASLTLVPAVLSLLGDNVNRLRVPIIGRSLQQSGEESIGGFWDRVSHGVMKKPVISLLLAAGLLVAAAVPFLDIKNGFAAVSTFPDNFESKKGFLVIKQEFPDLLTSRARVVIDGQIDDTDVQDAIAGLRTRMEADDNFGVTHLETNEGRDLAVVTAAVTGGDASSEAAISAVKRLRLNFIPETFGSVRAEVLVAGETAFYIDFFKVTNTYSPLVFTFVLGMSFLLLLMVFRSIVVSVLAIILNLLSVGAAYGLLVLVFQKGVGNDLLGFQQIDTIEAYIPLFLFAVLFGISMDYHIFLLSRIRERFDQTGDNAGSVAFGIRTTGRLITGAALIMVAVFGGFAFGGSTVDLQQFGFGLGIAVLLDATIVRMVIVPAAMKLLGNWNRFLPGWLHWLPDVRIEAEQAQAEAASD